MKYICLMLLLLTSSLALAADDVQAWETLKITYNVFPEHQLQVENESRYSPFDKGFFYTHNEFGGTFSPGFLQFHEQELGIKIGGFYRHILEKKDEWLMESRPYVDLTLYGVFGRPKQTGPANLLKLSSRTRVELRIFEQGRKYRFRNRIMAEFRAGVLFDVLEDWSWWIRPSPLNDISVYFSNEMFASTTLDRNRLVIGSAIKFKPFKVRAYYMLQAPLKAVETADKDHVIGINTSAAF